MAEVNDIQEIRGHIVAGEAIVGRAAAQMLITSFQSSRLNLSLYYIFGFLCLNFAGLLIAVCILLLCATCLLGLRLLKVPEAVIIRGIIIIVLHAVLIGILAVERGGNEGVGRS